MIIIGISDIHGDVENVKLAGGVLSGADVVVISGDITNFGGRSCIECVIETVRQFNRNIFAVSGNCDNGEVSRYLEGENIDLDEKVVEFKGLQFCGVEGALPGKSGADGNFNDGFSDRLEDIKSKLKKNSKFVFVSHQPAYMTTVDLGQAGHRGIGSIRKFIEETQPLLAFSGHVHEAAGTDKIGETVLANPEPLRFGGYAYCELSKNKVELCEIRNLFA